MRRDAAMRPHAQRMLVTVPRSTCNPRTSQLSTRLQMVREMMNGRTKERCLIFCQQTERKGFE